MSTDSLYSRKNPFLAPLPVNRLLTGKGSEKETRHFELSLAGSGLTYEVGDSLGVFPKNDPALVDELIKALHASGEEEIPATDGGAPRTLREALIRDFAIKEPSPQFVKLIAERAGDAAPTLNEFLDPERKHELQAHLYGLETIDLLLDHPSVRLTVEEFVKTLRRLVPRLYSIASSQRAHPDSVHLTIAVVRYETNGRARKGVASTFLADRVDASERVPVFVHSAKGFRLPEDGETPIIMVGPGTGVAPFRAYLQDRRATGARGKNWLFFGEQRAATGFLYEEEFAQYLAEGVLTRLDTAFSRDQPEKIYVQQRMREQAAEIWRWLEEGAHFYVCGDAARMAKDVDHALHEIVAQQGGKTPEQTAEYIETLKKTKRYKRDVY